ncbi:MAG: PIG-L family deacetylase [Saprospiraceae bacterium]|nr:PIG-L family deacetylase [Saprospiraceae bacterium]
MYLNHFWQSVKKTTTPYSKNQNIKSGYLIIIYCVFTTVGLFSQAPAKWTSGEIYQNLERLNFLGSVLYVAAHPDDENTRLISYLANDKKAFTTYLSLTRGDGGQNLIGTEISELLGVLRTQELLMARTTDNGHQMFTRANDFGYSKNAEETIKIWDTEKVKADVVWAIRKMRPDVIINRFDHRTSGETHGHHTASAQLALELFDKTGDPKVNPEHLKYVQPWNARRIFFNTSWWFYGSQEKFEKADKSALMGMDVGTYFPLLGKSNTEIAAESRSKHKCQGFGSTGTRGSQMEYLELLKGDMPAGKQDIFEGINTTWSRVNGGEEITALIDVTLKEFSFLNPEKSIANLIQIHNLIQKTEDPFWKEIKTKEVKDLIAACLGLYAEAKTNVHKATKGEILNVDFELTKRLPGDVILQSIKVNNSNIDTVFASTLEQNESFKWSTNIPVKENFPYTAPYWLTKKGSLGLYNVEDQALIGLPETPRTLKAQFHLNIAGNIIVIEKDIVHKFNSPENGETYRPLEIVPALTVSIKEPVYIFNSEKPVEITLTVHAWKSDLSGTVFPELPVGWKAVPAIQTFQLNQKGESKNFRFSIYPPNKQEEVYIRAVAESNGEKFTNEIIDINYGHIPFQTVVRQSETKLSRIQIETRGKRIAYIMGAGDQIPQSLQQIGYQVDLVKPLEISAEKMAAYDAVILGVRAYNTEEQLRFKQPEIMEYVRNGGNVIVQYNTSNGLVTKELGPYPITLSRSRTAVEEAEMRFLLPEHDILNKPNIISSKDFEGWVQERGLYFPGEWDSQYDAVLSCNDPGEPARDGVLLVAKHGEGHYIYTGLSFFRQLPAGVSGAFRLFANMISLGKTITP